MADRSRLLQEVLKKGWPTSSNLKKGDVVRTVLADEIRHRLNKYRVCMLVGQPRSGKTTLARFIGWEVLEGKKDSVFNRVRYLDLTEIENPDDIQDIIRMDKSWLLIIDNWHAAPHCHDDLLKRVNSDWKGIGCLIVQTVFPTSDEVMEIPSPLTTLKQGAENIPITTEKLVNDIAIGMIERHVQKKLGIESTCVGPDLMAKAKLKNAYFDQDDYQKALSVPGEHKRVRGNLRFLSWRLYAWNPTECHLCNINLEKVINLVDQTIVSPFRIHVGTLEKIAALAQWELPYLRGAGQNPPNGIKELEKENVVVLMRRGTGWQMDSTDAYLVILVTSGNNWEPKSLELLKTYLQSSPEHTPSVIRNILHQAVPDISTTNILNLLEIPIIQDAERKFLMDMAGSDRLSFAWLNSFTNCLLRRLPDDQTEADRRLNVVSVLFCKEIAKASGKSARSTNLQSLMWFISNLDKGVARFSEFTKSFFESYGEDALLASLRSTPSWNTRQRFLTYLKHFDAPLCDRLRSQLRSSLVSLQEIPFNQLLYQLMLGSIETGPGRGRKVEILAKIDEEYLLKNLAENPRAAGRLQFLLSSALWLSKSQAWRLAGIVPRIWPKLGVSMLNAKKAPFKNEAGKMGFLVKNCLFANQTAAQDLVQLFLGVPLSTLVLQEETSDIGKFLSAIERVQPGTMKGWCSTQIDYLLHLFLTLETDKLDNLLISLVTYAPSLLLKVFEKGGEQVKQRLYDANTCHNVWLRHGVLSLCGEIRQQEELSNLIEDKEIAACEPANIVLALYGLQVGLGLEPTHSLLSLLANLHETSPWIPFLLARNPMPWEREQIADMVNVILKGGLEPRTSALYNLILVVMILRSIEWEIGHRFNVYQESHRAIQTAIQEKMLNIERIDDERVVRATLNDQHPMVRSVQCIFQRILEPAIASPLTLHEWDNALYGIGTTAWADYFRSKVVKARIVAWEVIEREGQLEPLFSRRPIRETQRLYELIGLHPIKSEACELTSSELTSPTDLKLDDLRILIRWVKDIEVASRFVSVKGMIIKFSNQLDIQNCLQFAIDSGIFSTYYLENPQNPMFPILACRLNQEHPLVRDVLQITDEAES